LRTAVFSIISPNYRHYARVLMESVRRHQVEWDRYVLLVGDDGAAIDEELFEIASTDPERPLTEHKARGVAEALRRHDMFDEIAVEPRGAHDATAQDTDEQT